MVKLNHLLWKKIYICSANLSYCTSHPTYIGWIKRVGVLNLSSYLYRLIKMFFEVRGLTAEILDAGIIVQECWQGSKLRVAYSFAGVGHFQKRWEH